MSDLEDPCSIIRQKITKLSADVLNKYRTAILPIYGSTENGTFYQIGTSMALELQDKKRC